MSPPLAPAFQTQGYHQPQLPQSLIQDTMGFQSIAPYQAVTETPDWAYGMQTASQPAYWPVSSVHRALAPGMDTPNSCPAGAASNPWRADTTGGDEVDD